MNISIFAAIWSQNLWDELILKNTISHFEKIYNSKKLHFNVFSYDPKNPFIKQKNISYHEYFPNDIKKISKIWNNIQNFFDTLSILKSTDLVIIWGGWLFFDNESSVGTLKNINQWLFRKKIIEKYNKKIIFHWIWINFEEYNHDTRDEKIKQLFTWVESVSVRDSFSKKYLERFWIIAEYIYDPVYSDNGKYTENQSLQIGKCNISDFSKALFWEYDFKNKKVWFALRWFNWETYEKQIIGVLEYLIQKWAEITILPHSFHKHDPQSNDLVFFQNLLKKYYVSDALKSVNSLAITQSMQDTYNIYTKQKCDLVIASRLHSIILSRVYHIPYFAVSYSRKTDEQL